MNISLLVIVHAVLIWGYLFASKLWALVHDEPYPADDLYKMYIAMYGYTVVSSQEYQKLKGSGKISSVLCREDSNDGYAVRFCSYEDYAMYTSKYSVKFTWYVVFYVSFIITSLFLDAYPLALLLAYAGFGSVVVADEVTKHYMKKIELRNHIFCEMFSSEAVFQRKLKFLENSRSGIFAGSPINDVRSEFKDKVLKLYAAAAQDSLPINIQEFPRQYISRMVEAGLRVDSLRVKYEWEDAINAIWDADHGTQKDS